MPVKKYKLKANLAQSIKKTDMTESKYKYLRDTMKERMESKTNLAEHLKFRRGDPDGSELGSRNLLKERARSELRPAKGDLETTANNTGSLRSFKKKVPSVNDTDIKKLINKYPKKDLS